MAGEAGNRDGRALAAGDLAEQAAELAGLIHTIRPQVIVTYDERGGYGRPDHIRARTTSRWPPSTPPGRTGR